MLLPDTAPWLQEAAQTLVSAWRDGRRLPALAGRGPQSVAEAYQIQDAMIALIGPAGGWKVAPLRDGDPSCCPIPARFIHAEAPVLLPLPPGPALVEGEIAVRFARDLPPRAAPYGVDEIAAAIATVHPAIEVIASRYLDRAAQPALHCLADLQNCGGVVVGPGRRDWQHLDFAGLAGRLVVTGLDVAKRGDNPDTPRTLAALAWLAGHAHRRGTMLRAGDVVITGARLGSAAAGAGAAVTAGFAELGEVAVRLV